MTPASIQLIFGVLEVLLRVMGLLMVAGALFLFSLHSFAVRSIRVTAREEEGRLMLRPSVPRPSPFILRSTRNSQERSANRAASLSARRAA